MGKEFTPRLTPVEKKNGTVFYEYTDENIEKIETALDETRRLVNKELKLLEQYQSEVQDEVHQLETIRHAAENGSEEEYKQADAEYSQAMAKLEAVEAAIEYLKEIKLPL